MPFKAKYPAPIMKKILIILLFLCSLSSLSAQGNLLEIDNKPFRLGFFLGSNLMDLDVKPSEVLQDGKVYYAEVSQLVPGFTVGLITNLRLHRYFDLRFTPSLLLGERNLQFSTYDPVTGAWAKDLKVDVFSLPVDLPLNVRYSAERFGNFRPFVQFGGGTYFDLGRDELSEVTLKLSDFYMSFGFGCDFYFTFFKLSPEVKFNFGMMNILSPKDPTSETVVNLKYTNAISELLSRIVVFSLNIE